MPVIGINAVVSLKEIFYTHFFTWGYYLPVLVTQFEYTLQQNLKIVLL